jgi:hypothetical protein
MFYGNTHSNNTRQACLWTFGSGGSNRRVYLFVDKWGLSYRQIFMAKDEIRVPRYLEPGIEKKLTVEKILSSNSNLHKPVLKLKLQPPRLSRGTYSNVRKVSVIS